VASYGPEAKSASFSVTPKGELTASDAGYRRQLGQGGAICGNTGRGSVPPARRWPARLAPGDVYIYSRSGSTWTQQAKLTASDAASGDSFGYSVALSGTTALIGAPNTTVAGDYGVGAVYVFTGSGASWTEQTEISDPAAATNGGFGSSVALSGDSALIGADGTTVAGQADAGAAYVFSGSGPRLDPAGGADRL